MRNQLQRFESLRRRLPSVKIAVGWAAARCYGAAPEHGILITMRIDFDPQAMASSAFYRLLTAVVVPRPIAWVSTVSPDTFIPNLAPAMF